jgi:tetratricopeptide (TPR) repeat protein
MKGARAIAGLAALLLAAPAAARAQPRPAPAATSTEARIPDPAVARRLRERERWQQAVAASREATPEQKAEALGEVAGLYYGYDLPESAEPLYREARQLAPRDPRWPYYLGQIYRGANEPQQSIAMFRRAAELAPRDAAARVRLGEVLLEQGRLDEARAELERALALDPRCAAADFRLGLVADARGDRAQAAKLFAAALALQPDASAIHRPLGTALRALGREAEARAEFARAGDVVVALDDPLMARLYDRIKGWQAAMAAGDAAMAAGKPADAAASYRKAVAIDLLDVQSRVRLGGALAAQGDSAAAREQLELALKLAPGDPDAEFSLAYLDLRQGDAKSAIAAYRAGLAGRPDDVWARFNLAGALRASGARGDLEQALREYARLADLAPQNALVWLGRATALLQLGRCAEARAAIESGAARLPRDGALAQAQARLLATCPGGDPAKALEIATALYAARPEPEHAEALAMALAALGRYGEAVERQRQAIRDAEAAGKAALLPELKANLALFEAGRPSRTAWPPERMTLLTLAKGG